MMYSNAGPTAHHTISAIKGTGANMPKHNTTGTLRQRFKSAVIGMVLGLSIPALALGQTATLLPNAKQQYLDDSGNPVASGQVFYYVPNTTTKKTVWQDSNQAVPAPNPVQLDAAGRPVPTGQTFGNGTYRQKVLDVNGQTIWDTTTASTGGSGGGGGGNQIALGDNAYVGMIQSFSGLVAPTNYMFSAGQPISRATYPELLAVITYPLTITCSAGVSTIGGISDTTQIPIGAPLEASCFAPGTKVVSKTSSSVVLNNNATASTAVTGTFFPWGDGDGSTTFNLPNISGSVMAGRDNLSGTSAGKLATTYFGSNPNALGAIGGSQNTILGQAQMAGYTPFGTITNGAINSVVSGGVLGGTGSFSAGAGGSNSTPVNAATIAVTSSQSTSTFAGSNASGGIAVSATVASNGSGYTTGTQTVTLAGGTCPVPPQFSVTVSGGVISSPVLLTAGYCTVASANPVATTGGGGVGGTLNVTYTTTPVPIIQPTVTINYIIKVKADTIFTGSLIGITATPPIAVTAPSAGVVNVSLNTPVTVNVGGTGGTSFTAGLPVLGNGTSPFTQGTVTGNTVRFATSTGALTSNDCVKIDVSGNLVDSGSTCSSGSALSTPAYQIFSTPGAVTTLTLTVTPLPTSSGVMVITFDGVVQARNTWSIVIATGVVTFSSAIPVGTQQVEVDWWSPSVFGGVGSISGVGGAVTLGSGLQMAGQALTLSGTHVYNVENYGAKADYALVVYSMSSGSSTVVASSGVFTAADVGKLALAEGAGTAGGLLSTTIATYVSPTQVTLATPAITSATTKRFEYATDSTAGIQAAMTLCKATGGDVRLNFAGGYGVTKLDFTNPTRSCKFIGVGPQFWGSRLIPMATVNAVLDVSGHDAFVMTNVNIGNSNNQLVVPTFGLLMAPTTVVTGMDVPVISGCFLDGSFTLAVAYFDRVFGGTLQNNSMVQYYQDTPGASFVAVLTGRNILSATSDFATINPVTTQQFQNWSFIRTEFHTLSMTGATTGNYVLYLDGISSSMWSGGFIGGGPPALMLVGPATNTNTWIGTQMAQEDPTLPLYTWGGTAADNYTLINISTVWTVSMFQTAPTALATLGRTH